MPIQEESPGARPWIVFIGLTTAAQPKTIADFITWSSGSVVGRRHILTAAHVCKMLDLHRRRQVDEFGKAAARLVCIPGFHGVIGQQTRILPIGADSFVVSKQSLFSNVVYKNLDQYGQQIKKTLQADFNSSDLGMYFLDQKLPEEIPRAEVVYARDRFFDPKRKRLFFAHGYSLTRFGRLMYAQTHAFKAFPRSFALDDAPLGTGASGGPIWVQGRPRPMVFGTVSGFKEFNLGGPRRLTLLSGGKKILGIEDPETGGFIPLDDLDEIPPEPKLVTTGVAARITAQTDLEVDQWLKKR